MSLGTYYHSIKAICHLFSGDFANTAVEVGKAIRSYAISTTIVGVTKDVDLPDWLRESVADNS
jgi:hypothetical protein